MKDETLNTLLKNAYAKYLLKKAENAQQSLDYAGTKMEDVIKAYEEYYKFIRK